MASWADIDPSARPPQTRRAASGTLPAPVASRRDGQAPDAERRDVPLRRVARDDDARRGDDAVLAAARRAAGPPARADGRDPRRRDGAPAVEPAARARRSCCANPLQAWVEDADVDLEYHVRRSALPSPGDERELGILVSRLHGHPIDFHRPPWEVHLIEGLEGGRFAMYVKVHHALVDGYTAMRMLANALSHGSRRARPAAVLRDPAAGAPRREPRRRRDAERLQLRGAARRGARAVRRDARRSCAR